MPQHLVEVAFRGNRREFFLWEGETPPPLKAGVIVEADRGEDLGHVHAVGELAERRSRGVPHAPVEGTPLKKALRLATTDDEKRARELVEQAEQARRRAMERVKANALVMKLSDAEWQWDRKKLTFYFTAEKRVDFRALVRDLAAMFRTRIELKQIGVRDEARRLDGIGRCGRQYCSASWLPELRPVNLGVAKDQRLSLNPTQISGACGRLMCCLRYEHDFYVQSRKRFPKEGKVLVTARGEEKVVSSDIFNDRVTLRTVEGEMRVVPLAELRQELAGLDAEAPEGGVAAAVAQLPDAATDAPPPRPPRRLAPTSRPDPMRALPVVNAPAPAVAREAARLLEQVAPIDATAPEAADEIDAEESDVAAEETIAMTGTAIDAMPGATPPSDEAARRPRRRRGRRGGRRGRGGERPDGTRPDGAPLASDGGDDGEGGDGANDGGDAVPDDALPGDDDSDGA